jgi:hypothetical protein
MAEGVFRLRSGFLGEGWGEWREELRVRGGFGSRGVLRCAQDDGENGQQQWHMQRQMQVQMQVLRLRALRFAQDDRFVVVEVGG